MLTRRALLGATAAAAVLSGSAWLRTRPSAAASALTPYVDPLPIPPTAKPVGTAQRGPYPSAPLYDIAAQQVTQKFHRNLPATTVWGYNGSFPGPVIRATSGSPLYVQWRNALPNAPHPLWAPAFAAAHGPGIGGTRPDACRTVTHLHGMKCPADSDGWPETVILPGQGAAVPYFYPNDQEAATLWYHDHALGITRLNVYMGLAGFYLLSDAWEQGLALPRGSYDLPLAILDRSFNTDGSLAYPMVIAPEVFGDYITVNGKVSPYTNVARGKYRLRLLNACTARFLVLKLSDGSAFQQIASEQGLLPAPAARTWIRLAPGERAEVVVDFAGRSAGSTVELVNFWVDDVYPGDLASPPSPVVEPVLQFRVGSALGYTAPLPSTLRTVRPYSAGQAARSTSSQYATALPGSLASATRRFTVAEVDQGAAGSAGLCMNAENFAAVIKDEAGKVLWSDPLPFTVSLGKVEVWEFANTTDDTHPIHVHLVHFQVVSRQNTPASIQPGNAEGPGIWKDVVQVHPGETVRVAARYEGFAGKFPMHCHILDHEDCEMMRFFTVA